MLSSAPVCLLFLGQSRFSRGMIAWLAVCLFARVLCALRVACRACFRRESCCFSWPSREGAGCHLIYLFHLGFI